jgi:hypothetical protein
MADGGEHNLQFNELRHEAARAHLEKWFPKEHFRIVLAASDVLPSDPSISARQP